jgi:hypothetical protein
VKTEPNAKPSPYAKPGAVSGVRPALTRQPTAEERRRAQRVLLKMPVIAHIAKNPKPVEGFTHTVSATGAMIILKEGLAQGTKFILEKGRIADSGRVLISRTAVLGYLLSSKHQLKTRREPSACVS